MSDDKAKSPTQGSPKRARVTFSLMGKDFEVPEGMTLLNAMQVAGHEYLKGCGCRFGDCGECSVYYRKPGNVATLRDFSCIIIAQEGMEVMSVPFQWNVAFKRAQAAKG